MSGLRANFPAQGIRLPRLAVIGLLASALSLATLGRAEGLLDEYTLRHWNVEDGLPEGMVLSIEARRGGG